MTQTNTPSKKTHAAGYVMGIGFLIVAAGIVSMGPLVELPLEDHPMVRAEQIVPGAWREALTDPPMVNIGTFDMRCNHCHFIDMTGGDPGRALVQHREIHLNHGLNDACLNCHDEDNREKLTLRGGEVVGYNDVPKLCAQCHGPVYRDWQRGTHGKTMGYWNSELGESIKLSCTQCHDPHSPTYEPMPPLPGPHTLRMGDPFANSHGEIIDERNPLQRWRLNDHSGSGDNGHGGGHE